MIRLEPAMMARLFQLFQMAETCAAEAAKGLAFGMKHQADAAHPKVVLAGRMNGQADPQQQSAQAAQGAFHSFMAHTNELIKHAASLQQTIAEMTGQAKPETDEGGESGVIGKLG